MLFWPCTNHDLGSVGCCLLGASGTDSSWSSGYPDNLIFQTICRNINDVIYFNIYWVIIKQIILSIGECFGRPEPILKLPYSETEKGPKVELRLSENIFLNVLLYYISLNFRGGLGSSRIQIFIYLMQKNRLFNLRHHLLEHKPSPIQVMPVTWVINISPFQNGWIKLLFYGWNWFSILLDLQICNTSYMTYKFLLAKMKFSLRSQFLVPKFFPNLSKKIRLISPSEMKRKATKKMKNPKAKNAKIVIRSILSHN